MGQKKKRPAQASWNEQPTDCHIKEEQNDKRIREPTRDHKKSRQDAKIERHLETNPEWTDPAPLLCDDQLGQ